MKVNILGSEWKVKYVNVKEDDALTDKDGSCDRTTRTIVIAEDSGGSGFGDYKEYQRSVIRHEIIHAFLIESGLDNNWQHANQFGHEETMVDWIAIQFPKIQEAFKTVSAL